MSCNGSAPSPNCTQGHVAAIHRFLDHVMLVHEMEVGWGGSTFCESTTTRRIRVDDLTRGFS